ncbi:hypothetical protein [Streptomyces sp. ISL-12]|uniref:hypothetical protein n=1 Tax=Streptomyces sp. ISL-12 TaxID=2819177 RepID=UPI0027DFDD6D|nr:hypothetical protein [Streptomyces sp. ISL-12]
MQTLEEAGITTYPFGFVVAVGSNEVQWQVTGQLADGEKHDTPTADVDGGPAPWTDSTVQDGGEEWLAAVIGRAEAPQIAAIARWSTKEGSRPDHVGVTVTFHNGAKAFVRRI